VAATPEEVVDKGAVGVCQRWNRLLSVIDSEIIGSPVVQ
jgi:hypothetical protein